MVVALLPSERSENGKWTFDASSDPARRSGLLLSVPILIADISVGGLVPAAGDPALTCGQVLRAKIDEDSLVVHELGGADPDLAKYVNLSPLQTLPLNHRGKLGLCLQTLFVLRIVLSYIYTTPLNDTLG